MIISRIINYLRGYVTVKVIGKKAEKLINIAVERDIELWNIRRKNNYILIDLSIKGYKELWKICRRISLPMKIEKKRGLPFLLHKLWKRKIFAIGIILFILSLYILSSFVWFVEVEGLENIDEGEFTQFIKENDLKPGTLKMNLDTEDLEHKLRVHFTDIAWVSINITGTQVKVEVVEKDGGEITEKGPSNVVAKKDGMITKILALSGQPEVKVGQVVAKNQVLITGQMFNEESRTHMLVRSFGVVEAKVWYEGYGEALPEETEFVETGNSVTIKYLNIFGRKVKISGKSNPFERFNTLESVRPMQIRTSKLPVELITITYNEVVGEIKKRDVNQLEELAYNRALAAAERNIPENIEVENKTITIIEKNDTIVRVKVVLETIEEIGKVQAININ